MPKYQLHSVAAKTSLKRLIPGEVLIQQGDIGVEMYVIIRGTVKVYIDGAEISEVGSLNVMGECINDPVRPRSATVIAISHLSCVVITR
jgi:CRP-like cAMP-binding protein